MSTATWPAADPAAVWLHQTIAAAMVDDGRRDRPPAEPRVVV